MQGTAILGRIACPSRREHRTMFEPESSQNEALRREALAWLAQVALGEATKSDMESLRRWRDTSPAHAAALARAGRLWRGLKGASESLVRSGAVTLPPAEAAGFRPSRRALLGAGAAAMAAATAGVLVIRPPMHLWPSLAELGADYRTATGEQRQVGFADAVSVQMNTQTSIAARTPDGAPGIELISGEVAVTIGPAASSPFVVVAGAGRITAQHGTFSLRRDDAVASLTCLDGEVAVSCDGRSLTLGAAQRIAYDSRGLGDVAAADPEAVAWRDGMLVFHDMPLSKVIDEVNRYRAGKIVLLDSALGRRTVTARFELSRLDTVMLQIRHVFKATVRTLPGGIVLVG
uniref:Putative FecR n=1 Tax=Rhodopseudomonas palustris (strain BisA53) TaxID=316055 RepID=Q07N91_RHOP5